MKRVFIFALLILLLAVLVVPVSASSGALADTPAGPGFDDLLIQWAGMAGFAALIALLINIGKTVGIVKDGQAPVISAGLNLLGLAGLLAARVFRPDMDMGALDTQVAGAVEVGVVIMTYVMQLLASKATHKTVTGLPVIGKSYTDEMIKRAIG